MCFEYTEDLVLIDYMRVGTCNVDNCICYSTAVITSLSLLSHKIENVPN